MRQLLLTVFASALALALNGAAFAAEKASSEAQTSSEQSQAQRSGDASPSEEEYQAALKQCEPMQGADRQNCILAAKKKFGQM
jgi:hypothetical protein